MTDQLKTDPKKPAAPVVETPARFTLKTGTKVTVEGVEVQLVSDTEIEGKQSDHDKLAELAGTTFEEYPKRVSKDGVEKNVNGPEEEAAFLNPPAPRKTNLEDVAVEHDHTRTRPDTHKKK